jgi:predicted esterase
MEKRSAVKVLLDYLEENYAISGIYILGFSANSIDAFQIAEQYANRFAGVVGMPGNPSVTDQGKLHKYSDTKILMIAGERDTYWRNRAAKAKKKLDASGVWNNLIIVPNGGHILDEYAGAPLFRALNALLDK